MLEVPMHRVALFTSLLMFAAPVAANVTDDDFRVDTTRQLLALCTVSADDPRSGEAIHFCYGYLVGAYAFHEAWMGKGMDERLVCPPDPAPTRDDAVEQFVAWAKSQPEYLDDVPVDVEFRFLMQTWPCQK